MPGDQLPFIAQLGTFGVGYVLTGFTGNGAFAGATAAAVTCPMDVVKTRLQVQVLICKRAVMSFRAVLRLLLQRNTRTQLMHLLEY